MNSPVPDALAHCENLIANHNIQIAKYEILLARTPRGHPGFGFINMLLVSEQERLQLEQDLRLWLLDRMFDA